MINFGALGLVTKLIIFGGLALALVTVYGVWHYHVWSNGYDKAIVDIATQDKKAISRAQDYRGAFNDCRARGLRWDQSTGQCQGG